MTTRRGDLGLMGAGDVVILSELYSYATIILILNKQLIVTFLLLSIFHHSPYLSVLPNIINIIAIVIKRNRKRICTL